MKSTYQSFNRGAIPVSYPVNIISEDEYTDPPVEHLNTPRVLCLSLLAAANAAVLAQCLLLLINGLMNLSFLGRFSLEEADPTDTGLGIFIIAIPVLGGGLAILLIRYCRQNHLIEPLCMGIYIGTGIPLGIEGAVVASSYIFSNFTKNKWRTTYPERRILAAAGIVSGIAYLFGSPVAAVALALELLLVEFTLGSIFPLILAGVVGASFHFLYRGMEPVFAIPEVPVATASALLGYVATGVIVGFVAVFVTRTVSGISRVFGKLPVPLLWRPLVGAVIIGVMGYFAPDMLGMGYGHISDLLLGKVTLQLLFIVGIVKFIAWTVALGSGTPGGTVLPLLIMGGAFGLFITLLLQFMMPDVPLNFSVAALIGMAAMLAGGLRILPAAIFFAIETTHERHAILPLICACTAAYLVSFLLSKRRINREVAI
ncbi:Voltage gated chloride channel [Chitinophaga sp. YR573]|uniref:chloride channel protein n=1 Tax=Chitinophaga sp. YR573 TaxID=1881040 RepID=UPI0008B39D77|nr:chloride channel protein [Chitinophaga sp. YR573]SEW09220.1 Voltage gated chloride channel [Chitinophaga sp. YR573]